MGALGCLDAERQPMLRAWRRRRAWRERGSWSVGGWCEEEQVGAELGGEM